MTEQADHAHDQAAVQVVTIPQAAQAFGVSVVTIRRRLKRGELRGQKVSTGAGFEWRILVPAHLVDAAALEASSPPAQGATQPGDAGGDQRLITALQAQLAEYRTELDARRREVQELHVLLARWQPALPPPLTSDQADQATPDHEVTRGDQWSPDDQDRPLRRLRSWWSGLFRG